MNEETLNVQRSTPNVQRPTPNAQRPTLNAQRSTLKGRPEDPVTTLYPDNRSSTADYDSKCG